MAVDDVAGDDGSELGRALRGSLSIDRPVGARSGASERESEHLIVIRNVKNDRLRQEKQRSHETEIPRSVGRGGH